MVKVNENSKKKIQESHFSGRTNIKSVTADIVDECECNTCNYLQRIISQDSVPEKKQLISRQVARKSPHHPLKGNTQPGDTIITFARLTHYRGIREL